MRNRESRGSWRIVLLERDLLVGKLEELDPEQLALYCNSVRCYLVVGRTQTVVEMIERKVRLTVEVGYRVIVILLIVEVDYMVIAIRLMEEVDCRETEAPL